MATQEGYDRADVLLGDSRSIGRCVNGTVRCKMVWYEGEETSLEFLGVELLWIHTLDVACRCGRQLVGASVVPEAMWVANLWRGTSLCVEAGCPCSLAALFAIKSYKECTVL